MEGRAFRQGVSMSLKGRAEGSQDRPQDQDQQAARLLAAALAYASRGWRVIPLHHVVNGKCSCSKADCGSPGKHPRTQHGVKDGTTDASTIRGWWQTWPSANVAICTGPESGLWVLGP